MSTILNKIIFTPNKRPKYTKYEISNMVRNKRLLLGLSQEKFADKYNISCNILKEIELAKRNFNYNIYNICSNILEKSIEELLQFDEDIFLLPPNINNETKTTINLANTLFQEMVMQSKINK